MRAEIALEAITRPENARRNPVRPQNNESAGVLSEESDDDSPVKHWSYYVLMTIYFGFPTYILVVSI